MAQSMRRRWSDNDRCFGPFTYSRDNKGYRPLAIELSSGCDECPGAQIRFSGLGHTLIIALPAIIKPDRRWVDTSHYSWSSGPNSGYWDINQRQYGFSLWDGHLSISFGRSTMDSSTDQQWGCFLPWTQWRFVRRSFFGLDGERVSTVPDTDSDGLRRQWDIKEATPTASFRFRDFDDEEITATTLIEEREWLFGTGWFKWLSWFRKPKVRRSLDIDFSSEVGPRKGSWKGGTIGDSIEMQPGELHEAAFQRYCAENNLTFLAVVPTPEKGGV